jgi:hypothetical protein
MEVIDVPFIDIAAHSINKFNEELCGDKVEIVKSDKRTIIVLADGLGSGVKANILATLTSKIMITMLQQGAELKETIETITSTLPICSVRNIAYSTFTILDIDDALNARLIEYDNPPAFIIRGNKLISPVKRCFKSDDKDVWITELKLEVDDEITLCSDGVIHAGVGVMLNHGWEWPNVGAFLEEQTIKSAEKLNRRLLETCNNLYDGKPGDDATVVTIRVRTPEIAQIFTGPPDDYTKDEKVIRNFMSLPGKKIVCGGTAANILARELGREIITDLEYIDRSVPPTATIKGIDLVTEGVLTLKMVLNRLTSMNHSCEEPIFNKHDGVTKLLKLFVEETTHIQFWVGRAINPAHQNPEFPKDLSIKINIIKEIERELSNMGKFVKIIYTD